MKSRKLFFMLLMALVPFFYACDTEKQGTLQLNFNHNVDGEPLERHQLRYENAAGNLYEVEEVKYFVSRICLVDDQNRYIAIPGVTENPHYVDMDIPETMSWQIPAEVGDYKGIAFVFGLNEEDNVSRRFPNPPEANFAWPDFLGGGYHYMQIIGKWQAPDGDLKTMNFHTGIGQLYEENSMQIPDIYQYVHNHFLVTIPCEFSIGKNGTTSMDLIMNIENWFQSPNVYDHNYFGGSIMQNQEAQAVIKQNGWDVFTIGKISEL